MISNVLTTGLSNGEKLIAQTTVLIKQVIHSLKVCCCLYLNPWLYEVKSEGQRLSHENVRIVTLVKSFLQFFQLPAGKIRPRASSFTARAILIRVSRIYKDGI